MNYFRFAMIIWISRGWLSSRQQVNVVAFLSKQSNYHHRRQVSGLSSTFFWNPQIPHGKQLISTGFNPRPLVCQIITSSTRYSSSDNTPPPTTNNQRIGEILIENEQSVLPNVNIDSLQQTLEIIRQLLGYPNYDVSLLLADDQAVRELNAETRGIDSSTDILSFPIYVPAGHDDSAETPNIVTPGVLPPPPFEVADYYTLGDMIISVPYVIRACQKDQSSNSFEAIPDPDDPEYEWVDDDRGISGAMATEFDPETRLHMLLVHGMLHLVGYDHENDHDYELMVAKEDEILKLLKDRKGGTLI